MARWAVAGITLLATIVFSVYLQGRGLLGMLPILLGAIVGYIVAIPFGLIQFGARRQRSSATSSTLPT